MRRALLPLLLALAACSSNGGGGTTPTTANVAARFPLGAEANVIQVTVTDRQAARAADLVLPDGTVQPAYSLDTERAAVAADSASARESACSSRRSAAPPAAPTPTRR